MAWSSMPRQDDVSTQKERELFRCLKLTAQVDFKSWHVPLMIGCLLLISLLVYVALNFFMPFSIVVLFYKAGMQEDTLRKQQFMHSYTTRAHAHIFTHTHTLNPNTVRTLRHPSFIQNSSGSTHSCCKN